MDETPKFSRRTALETIGLFAVSGFTGVASASSRGTDSANDGTLRLSGEVAVDGATEVVPHHDWKRRR